MCKFALFFQRICSIYTALSKKAHFFQTSRGLAY
jgi:hypothetical protein